MGVDDGEARVGNLVGNGDWWADEGGEVGIGQDLLQLEAVESGFSLPEDLSRRGNFGDHENAAKFWLGGVGDEEAIGFGEAEGFAVRGVADESRIE